MAEALLIPAATGILKRLLSLAEGHIEGQIKLAWDFKQNLIKLCNKLKIIQGLLNDAERNNQNTISDAVIEWLKQLKAVTCEAEIVLDELAYEVLRRTIEDQMKNKVHYLFTLSDPLSFRFKMANKIDKINKQLGEVCKLADEIGLKLAEKLIGPILETTESREDGPFIEETEVVGRDGDVSKLVDMLLGSDIEGDFPVIAILGMPGVGKTTLAQIVYDKAKVKEKFCDKRIWICVSDNFNVINRLLNEMVESLTGEKCDVKNRQGVLKRLGEKLNAKKYLLVLDDVWNTETKLWVDLRNALKGIGDFKESKILITTRNMEVILALKNSPYCIHPLGELSEEDSWTMFTKKAFGRGGPIEGSTLVEIGRRMVAKCKGVPLAINALGGLLYSKDEREWKSIEKSETWRILENKDGILPALRLSFDHLAPPALKQCFSCCSIFPKDKIIEKDFLIQLWMALGYLQSSSRSEKEMEEVGHEYFMILWRNSLFQEVQFHEEDNSVTCKMHDLVHDLALHVSKDSCLTLECGEMKKMPNVQHLSLFCNKQTRLDISEENVSQIRTLFLKGHLPKNTKHFKCIHVLRLVDSDLATLKCCKSIHLRFLDLSESCIIEVPNFITKLYNLETLILPEGVEELPKNFHNLVRLRHWYIKGFEDIITRCSPDTRSTVWYNSDSGKWIEIIKLMPTKIGRLTYLQTLPFFVLGKKSGHKIEELGSLTKLRGRLRIFDLQHVKDKDEAKKAKILEKSDIQEFLMEWDDEDLEESDNNHEDVLEGLQPPQNVKVIELLNFGGRSFASWMSRDAYSLQNLVNIKLRNCRFCEEVPTLGQLPNLADLVIDGLYSLKSIGQQIYGVGATGVFPALINFELRSMPQLEEWSDDNTTPTAAVSTREFFPRLQLLKVDDCPKLRTLPAFKGSNSLRRLTIRRCVELTCLPEGLLRPTLEDVEIFWCAKLKKMLNPVDEIEEPFNGSTSLRSLSITDCGELTCLPRGLLQPSLARLVLQHCRKLQSPNPYALRTLTSLETLTISCCPNWGSCLEEGLVCTSSLRHCGIGGFGGEYSYLPWPFTSAAASPPSCHFASLETLSLHGWPEVKFLPDQVEHLPALKKLVVSHFTGLESLPEWVRDLTSLQSLRIWSCPLLENRCQKETGQDWCKIAHIPTIRIEFKTIQGEE